MIVEAVAHDRALRRLDLVEPPDDLVVRRRDAPIAVEFFDARPSWTSTFVRRALESDSRFHVESLSVNARALSTRTAGAVRPGDRQLDAFAAVVVGGLERLSATASSVSFASVSVGSIMSASGTISGK